MAESTAFSVRRFLLLLIPPVILVGCGAAYLCSLEPTAFPYADKMKSFLRTGLVVPTELAKGLVDKDGNLVADPPPVEEQLDPDPIVFAVLGSSLEKEQAIYADLVKHLEKSAGKKVKLVLAEESQPDELRNDRVHLTNLSTGAVSTAVNAGGAVPFCVMGDSAGKFGYNMEIIVSAGSPFKSPADLRGKSILFVSAYSHSGFKAPVVTLWKKFGMMPGRDYDPYMQGSQEMLVKEVAKGKLAAGAVASDLLKRMIANGEIDEKAIRSIYVSESFPTACYAYTNRLKPELAKKITDAFFDFKWEGTSLEKAYAPAGQTKFVPISYKDAWAPVREMERAAVELVQQVADEKKK